MNNLDFFNQNNLSPVLNNTQQPQIGNGGIDSYLAQLYNTQQPAQDLSNLGGFQQQYGPNGLSGTNSSSGLDFGKSLTTTPPNNNDKGFLSKNFKNGDGSLNFSNIGATVGGIKDVLGAYMAIRQFGLAKDGLNHSIALDKANLANSTKLAQSRLDLQSTRRAAEGSTYNAVTNPQLQQTINP